MRAARRTRAPVWAAALLMLAVSSANAEDDATACERAAAAAEPAHGVPNGLLRAIGLVEAGRRDPALGRTSPWPWTTDIAGAGRWWATRAEAAAAVRAARASGASVDVGCFQINLPSHPAAFATLDDAFDPATNADYAAGFLALLHDRLGSWSEAAGAYHSGDAALAEPYRRAVLSAWAERPEGWDSAASPAAARPPTPSVRVWGPSGLLTAAPVEARTIRFTTRVQRGMPRVVKPGRTA